MMRLYEVPSAARYQMDAANPNQRRHFCVRIPLPRLSFSGLLASGQDRLIRHLLNYLVNGSMGRGVPSVPNILRDLPSPSWEI